MAVVLFIVAAFARPTPPPQQVAAPGSPVASGQPEPTASSGASSDPSGTASPAAPAATPSPVATAAQIVAEEVGDYRLVDQRPGDPAAQAGALETVDLRYETDPPEPGTEVFHVIEVHVDRDAADARVRTFARAMTETGLKVIRAQPLRATDGGRQGHFIALEGAQQRVLLWSNENVTFSLGGGAQADVDAFYDSLPY